MLFDVVDVEPLRGYVLRLKFEDGVEGTVDVSKLVSFDGIFSIFSDEVEFNKVRVDPETGTICWPNGADLDPVTLYQAVTRVEHGVSGARKVG